MFARPPASRANRSHAGDLLRALTPTARRAVSQSTRSTRAHVRPATSSVYTSSSHSWTSRRAGGTWLSGKRPSSTTTTTAASDAELPSTRKDTIYGLIDKINQYDAELAGLLDELSLFDHYLGVFAHESGDLDDAFSQTIGHRDEQTLESRVRSAKQRFGDTLPEDYLNATELQLYTRLYGEPIYRANEVEAVEEEDEIDGSDRLLREDGEGGWEEVEYESAEASHDEVEEDMAVVYDMETGPIEEETHTMRRTREVAEQLGGQIMLEQFEDEAVPGAVPRLHPLTEAGKFTTDPSTVFLPVDTVTGPISVILSDFSNKHITDTAQRVFGGQYLPHSTTTPALSARLPQLPIPISASQHHMTEMEANAYLAALYPGIYASVISVLAEVRKRLGTQWIRDLISQEGGPNVLDAGGGGAGILAWRDILRAEWQVMAPDHSESDPIPFGRSTVLAGSETLKLRASVILENTTFLPRLPDYVHVRTAPTLDDARPPPKRKQYDVIIAPHTLLGIEDDYLRKDHVENLWELLNPNGGVLILLEKGRQRGFEAIAGAREMLLKRHISSPGSSQYEDLTESPDEQRYVDKEAGMIIAPCTNHATCPMYSVPGKSKGRKDYCHFQQRYIRPSFLQRIIGAKDKNHEDVKFSYLAVQRGVDLRKRDGIVQGQKATDAAFEGYEELVDTGDSEEGSQLPPLHTETETTSTDPASSSQATDPGEPLNTSGQTIHAEGETMHTLSLPRTIYPPMKRRGHVIFDFCTPAGKIERWTVPRSWSKQAYRDARKARWGDLWALGAKTRIPRNLALGLDHNSRVGEGKRERLLVARQLRREEEEDEEDLDEDGNEEFDNEVASQSLEEWAEEDGRRGDSDRSGSGGKKGKRGNIPSWKKHADKKRVRQAAKRTTARQTVGEI